MNQKKVITSFSEEDMKNFEPTMKVGLLASVNPQGLPHITLLASMMAASPQELVWGQFTEGSVYEIVKNNPKTSFLIMNMQKELWRGKAVWREQRQQGREFDLYNNQPMFRYNAYFGIHTVHYLDLQGHSGKQALPMNKVVPSAVLTLGAKFLAAKDRENEVMNPWTRKLMDKIGNLKFLAYVGEDGFPNMIPVIQAVSLDSSHILFESSVYSEELQAIPTGTPLAIFGMELDMTDVVLRGEFQGLKRYGGIRCGKVKVNWVYNAMPPNPQQIFPPMQVKAVREF